MKTVMIVGFGRRDVNSSSGRPSSGDEPPVTTDWAGSTHIGFSTERLVLTPLVPDDADKMVDVLADQALHEFIGGEPETLEGLRDRYRRLVAGSSRVDEVWLNWILRRRSDDEPVGTVQATLVDDGGSWTAQVAWVVGAAWQHQGYASEAARALVDWLQSHGVVSVLAHIHPDHQASAKVAARAGLRPTSDEVDGERVWRADTRTVSR